MQAAIVVILYNFFFDNLRGSLLVPQHQQKDFDPRSQAHSATMLTQLTQFWLDEHHSDVLLNIVAPLECLSACQSARQLRVSGSDDCRPPCSTLPAAAGPKKEMHRLSVLIPCHRVLLSAASAYFSALFSPAWSGTSMASDARIVPVVLSDAGDIPAMMALLKSIYCGEINVLSEDVTALLRFKQGSHTALPQHASLASTAEANSPIQCSCTAALSHLSYQLERQMLCWQELSVRVIRLADQFSVPGALKVAAAKLSCLFSYQLSWPAVLAVLWLPGALAQQPCLRDLRQMAMNRVIQDLMLLDHCLSSSFGRSVLQQLPPDALATLLASDQLALVSENSTLAAIDVWLAGPVAETLGNMQQGETFDTTAGGGHAFTHQKESNGLIGTEGDSFLQMCSRNCNVHNAAEQGGATVAAAMQVDAPNMLFEALQLLMRQVRLPLCSGAFLAAALIQRPWLCEGLRGNDDVLTMKQYYSLDSEGRYNLAMKLLRSHQRCPWSVMLRRGLPAAFNSSTSSIYSNMGDSSIGGGGDSSSNQAGVETTLSQMRALLAGQPGCGSVCGVGWLSSCSSSRNSSQTLDTLQRAGSSSSSSGSGSTEGACSMSSTGSYKNKKQQQQQHLLLGRQIIEPVQLLGGIVIKGLVIHERVLGGYYWRMALVAVPVTECDNITGAVLNADNISEEAEQKQQMQLCLHVCCKPAWATVLDATSSSSSDVDDDSTNAAPADDNIAACGAMLHSDAEAAAAGMQCLEPMSADADCVGCAALWTIAGAKAKEAIARHAPQESLKPAASCAAAAAVVALDSGAVLDHELPRTKSAAAFDTSGDNCNVFQQTGDYPSTLGTLTADDDSKSVKHLSVVVGIQVLACSSRDHLQQLLGDGPGSISSSSNGSPAQTHLACLLDYDSQTAAHIGLIPLDVHTINTGKNLLHNRGITSVTTNRTGVQQRVLAGWQPELWSMFAPDGLLHWHVGIRILSD